MMPISSQTPSKKKLPAKPIENEVVPTKAGRTPTVIDETALYNMANIWCTYDEMALLLGVSKEMLQRRFSDLIEKGRADGRKSLRRIQWEIARKGNVTMLVWLGKQELNQRDRHPDEASQVHFHVAIKEIPAA